jgi:ketosteroid isomerase-like protein
MSSVSSASAGPAEDAGAVVDRWAAAFNANDAEAVAKLYALDALLFGTG